ncbi:MAG: N-6 DNA methylase [Campylobacteraceae bacterium]|nr:N-6 DNA methylase [Campylobacteraceae bacterium]
MDINQNKKGGKYNARKLRNRQNEILFMDLRTWRDNPVKDEGKKKLFLSPEQIQKATSIYHTWQNEGTNGKNYEIAELYGSVGIDEIRSKNYALTPSKYIEFIDHDLEIDYKKEMSRIQKEMSEILKEQKEAQKMLENAFKGIGYEI